MKKFILALCLAGCAIGAQAQTLTISDELASSPDTQAVAINYTAGATDLASFSVRIDYDPAQLTPQTDAAANPNVNGCVADVPASHTGAFTGCNNPNPGAIALTVTDQFSGTVLPTTSVGSITFDVAAGLAPGTVSPIEMTFLSANDDAGTPLAAGDLTLNDGSITIQVPAGDGFYASTPAAGGLLDYGSAVVGNAATPADTLNVQNPSPDTAFNITGFGGGAGVLAFPGGTPITVPFGGNVDVNIACTPSARGDNGGSFTVAHDAANGATSPVSYDFDCAGLSPNVNVPAGPVSISGLTVDPNPLTADFNVTNPDDGFTSDAMNVTAAAAGDAEISVAPAGPLTIATNGSQTFTVSCDNSSEGSFTSVITIEWDDPVSGGTASETIDAECDVSSAIPSFDSDPGAPGPLAFGTVTNGTTSAPLGIDVFNDGVGPSPNSDLTISNVTTDDAQFDATLVNAGPFEVGDPADGTNDIEVTCQPDAGAGAIAGTLTVEHDGDDSPTLFDLTCQGESDGRLDSTPAPGGVLNLGVVPPQTSTPEGFIDFSNSGSFDDITVDCTVTDTAGVFTFTPDPIDFTIGPGGTESVGFQCTPPSPDNFSADVACTIGGDPTTTTADYSVVCSGQPLVIPTMSRWGLVVMSLMLLLVAGLAGRRMLA